MTETFNFFYFLGEYHFGICWRDFAGKDPEAMCFKEVKSRFAIGHMLPCLDVQIAVQACQSKECYKILALFKYRTNIFLGRKNNSTFNKKGIKGKRGRLNLAWLAVHLQK